MNEEKVITISEENRFHQHRIEIDAISNVDNVDISVAARKYAHSFGLTDYSVELTEFDKYIAYLQAKSTKENNLIAKYFGDDEA